MSREYSSDLGISVGYDCLQYIKQSSYINKIIGCILPSGSLQNKYNEP